MSNLITKTLEINKLFLNSYLNENAIAVDCTIGNGSDTLFLAEHCKFVYGFDIQHVAIQHTSELLEANHLSNYQLFEDSFENIDQHIPFPVDVIVFNLGYLPCGDKTITTTYQETLTALSKALALLKENGLVSIAMYWGHENGKKEREELLRFVQTLDSHLYHVAYLNFPNQLNCPPELLLITKKPGLPKKQK